MRKLLPILLSIGLLFSACGGSSDGESSEEDAYFFTYKTTEFEIEVPDAWETQTAFTADFPDEIRVAFINNLKDKDFVANVTVIREDNSKSYTNFDFTQKKLNDHAETLINYQLLSQEEMEFEIGSAATVSYLDNFQGKNSTDGSTLEFIQVSLTKGNKAYTTTATYLPSEDDFVIERMLTMLTSFTLK